MPYWAPAIWATIAMVVTIATTSEGRNAVAAQDHGHEGRELGIGQVSFPTSCVPAAQVELDRAVAMLHSFWFVPSRDAFGAALEADPSCAMAHWGIAMTWLGNPLLAQGVARMPEGRAAVESARSIGGTTQRERDYIEAIGAYYDGEVSTATRRLAYEQAMESLSLRYPDDPEAAIFYAVALNATVDAADKTHANQLEAARILEAAFPEQPDHPGITHYLIHSYDYPPLATRGLQAARRYAEIAPAVPHALHMPSHIFTRLGLWQESIESNRASAAADPTYIHAKEFMVYAYLQGAQDVMAKTVADEAVASAPPTLAFFALPIIPARYAIETRRWTDAASLAPWGRSLLGDAVTYFARAVGAARGGDPAAARADVAMIERLRDSLTAANEHYWAEQAEIWHLAAAAWLAHAEGGQVDALRLMRSAADMEDATEKDESWAGPIIPAREQLGELLLALGQPQQALVEFERSLGAAPNRFWGLYGAARAAQLAGDMERARSYFTQLLAVSQHADPGRPELLEARALLAVR